MTILVISDTHGKHSRLDQYLFDPEFIKDVDLIIHAGDASNTKTNAINNNELRDFFEWYSDINIPTKIFVPGNHDTSWEAGMIKEYEYPDINVLNHESIVIDDIKIFGSPYTPTYGTGWAYNKARHKIGEYWSEIPSNTDILVTHGPPKGILDLTHLNGSTFESVGCKSLLNKVFTLDNLKYHLFGHIHDEKYIINSGYRIINNTVFINASMTDLSYNLINIPIKIFI
jgi:Icc-related predicted phosphoesterase